MEKLSNSCIPIDALLCKQSNCTLHCKDIDKFYSDIVYAQGRGQVQLTKYSSTPSTPNIYQVQVLVKYSFFKVLNYIKYFHIKYKYKYSY